MYSTKNGSSSTNKVTSTSTSSILGKKLKKPCTTVDIMCVDARDKNQLPISDLNIDTMQNDNNYYKDIEFGSMDEQAFTNFMKLNPTFGESFAKEYYFYVVSRLLSREGYALYG